MSAILAINARAEILVDLFVDMVAAADGAIKGAVNADISDPIVAFKLVCGIDALPGAITMLEDASASVEGVVSGQVELVAAFAGKKTRAEW